MNAPSLSLQPDVNRQKERKTFLISFVVVTYDAKKHRMRRPITLTVPIDEPLNLNHLEQLLTEAVLNFFYRYPKYRKNELIVEIQQHEEEDRFKRTPVAQAAVEVQPKHHTVKIKALQAPLWRNIAEEYRFNRGNWKFKPPRKEKFKVEWDPLKAPRTHDTPYITFTEPIRRSMEPETFFPESAHPTFNHQVRKEYR